MSEHTSNYSGEMPENVSAADVEAALSNLPDGLGEAVVADIVASSIERKRKEEIRNCQYLIVAMATAAQQHFAISGESEIEVEQLDPISVETDVSDFGLELLDTMAGLDDGQRSQLPKSAIDFAALYMVMWRVGPRFSGEEANDILAPSGWTVNAARQQLLDSSLEHGLIKRSRLERITQALDEEVCYGQVLPFEVMEVIANTMHTDLLEKGFKIPELVDGLCYVYDEDEDWYMLPEITEANLPD